MGTIPKIASAMRDVLTTTANRVASVSGFVQRRSKLSGELFAQTLVFGWWSRPQATLEELADSASLVGCDISPQGLDQRFTHRAAELLGQLLAATVQVVVRADPVGIPLLARFTHVYLTDSTLISLPTQLHNVWRGCGNGAKPIASALKLLVRFDLLHGTLQGLIPVAGRTHDRTAARQLDDLPAGPGHLPPGALHLADLGSFDLGCLQAWSEQGVLWLTRLLTGKGGVSVYTLEGEGVLLGEWLAAQRLCPHERLQRWVLLGKEARLRARLLVQRVPTSVAQERRRKLRLEAKRRGQTVSAARLALGDWTILVTNVPTEQLSVEEALVLGRARWQIELLFRRWKSQGGVDEWRSHKPWRIMCEVYAKLIALVMQHWLLVASCWAQPARSLAKATRLLQGYAEQLVIAFVTGLVDQLERAICRIQSAVARRCRITKHKARPSSYQLLLHPSLGVLA